MADLLRQIGEILDPSVLFSSKMLFQTLSQPEFMIPAFIALTLIVFTETGLLIGFFLPGDSLLITAGLVAAASNWPLGWLMVILSIAAIVGDSVGYSIGYAAGPKLFQREKSWLFAKEHLVRAQEFYERHGGKTVILARFMPIIRTFAPVVAGIGKMNYARFVAYNIVGGITWVVSMTLTGYYLTTLIDPPFKSMFGPEFSVRDHVEKVIIIVVLLSISPALFPLLKAWTSRKTSAPQSLAV
jgi:membrane-associated protein